jgi:hypothetical protein
MVSQAQKTYTSVGSATAPVADGYIDEVDDPWEDNWTVLAEAKEANTDARMSAEFQVMNNNESIFLAVKIQDGTMGTSANSWERDCIEVFFAANQTHTEDGTYQAGDFQVRCQRDDDTFDEPGRLDGAVQIVTEYGVENAATEYSIEMIFSLDSISAGAENYDGIELGFEIACASNVDDARAQQQFWNVNTDNQYQNTLDFGNLVLAQKVSKADVAEAAGYAFVSNNMLKIKNTNGLVNVYNLKGALVLSANVDGSASLDVSALNKGMYIVKGANLQAKVVK